MIFTAMYFKATVIFLGSFLVSLSNGRTCVPRQYEYDSVVCVCNSTYCDDIKDSEQDELKFGEFLHYTSSRSGQRMHVQYHYLMDLYQEYPGSGVHICCINSSDLYQEIYGFGGAITDSVGINLKSLSNDAQEMLLRQYFGCDSIHYTFLRVPMAGTDFSTRFYTYDDKEGDENLSHFNLAMEDYEYKIPYIRRAQKLSQDWRVKTLALPWSPPIWMTETVNSEKHYVRLKDKYYQTLANYFVKFLDAYREEDVEFWAVSPQNEPGNGFDVYFKLKNFCGYSPEEQRKLIAKNLGPTLKNNGYEDVKIMSFEDQRNNLPNWTDIILEDEEAYKYTAGISVHWYFDNTTKSSRLQKTHEHYPDKFILYTEASLMEPPQLGSWINCEKYAHDIIEDSNYWVVGFIDWNIVLNVAGGPTYVKNYLDSPIIVNCTADEFYKQPVFYAIAHFSKFVTPGSIRIGMKVEIDAGIEHVAFLRPDGIIVIVILNRSDDDRDLQINIDREGSTIVSISAHSIHTMLYRSISGKKINPT
ncbi:lysosomal acid glucosylceramidase-like [Periplaneta americana]|uniref:lysosomal acid glucosylceramidase-like n=1 Tax=Periplaneta americana TaxID=6978 RepID=UPI0037E93BE3